MLDEAGRVVGTAGYYMDMTETLAEHGQETLDDRLLELYAARAVVESRPSWSRIRLRSPIRVPGCGRGSTICC
ncbi:hypothetical protein [Nocardia sp. NPDC059239]|uniref:hypothetical protein n=1 Tax=unclassified Nocardia TaxID=2637762 RepID=UPI0036904102